MENALARLAVRETMREFRYFVGREEAALRLRGCVAGRQRFSAWLYGPARIGKSSLASYMATIANENGTRVIWADVGDIPPGQLPKALQRVCDRAGILSSGADESPECQFESLARSTVRQPVVVIFDEFDHLALECGIAEQAFLRRLASENDNFSYLFITRLDPMKLLEEVPDHSRLLGIFNTNGFISSPKETSESYLDASGKTCRRLISNNGNSSSGSELGAFLCV